MKNIHIILFFTLWVILGSCSTYYVSNKQVMEVQQGMSRQNVEKSHQRQIIRFVRHAMKKVPVAEHL